MREGKGFCPKCKKPMKACTCEAEEAEGLTAEEAEEAEEAKRRRKAGEDEDEDEDEGEEESEAAARRKTDEDEDEDEGESARRRRKTDEAEEGEDEGEGEARTKVLLALRSKLDEAHDPETVSTLLDALKAYFDEEIAEAGEGGEGGGEEEPSEEEALASRQAAAEKDAFKKYAAEGEEEAQMTLLRGAAEKDGFKRYASEGVRKCKACGAPMKRKSSEAAAEPEDAEGLRHRLLEKEVRFQMRNDETGTLRKENKDLKERVTALEAELKPGKVLQEAAKYLTDNKVPEGFITAAVLAKFPSEQWAGIIDLTVPASLRESGGQGERVMAAPQYLKLFDKSLKENADGEAAGAFRESYGSGPATAYPGSQDAEDPMTEKAEQKQ